MKKSGKSRGKILVEGEENKIKREREKRLGEKNKGERGRKEGEEGDPKQRRTRCITSKDRLKEGI